MQLFTSPCSSGWIAPIMFSTLMNMFEMFILINKHAEIGDEFRAKQDEFGSLIQLGQKMYGRQPGR